eukprot:1046596-Amphidinium_carterae.1
MATWHDTIEHGEYRRKEGADTISSCGCKAGFRPDGIGSDALCIPCGVGANEGVSCPGGLTDEVVTLATGYFSDLPMSVFKCWGGEDRCPGNRRAGEVCDSDRDGLTCSLCREGKVEDINGVCVDCNPVSFTVMSAGLCAVAAGCAFLYRMNENRESSKVPDSTRRNTLACALTLTYMQQLGVLSSLPLEWESPVDVTLEASKTGNLNFNFIRV